VGGFSGLTADKGRLTPCRGDVEDEGGGDLERIFDKSLNTLAELITLVTLWNFLCLGEDFTGSASSSVSSVENR
jgi:hypothetical protein